MWRCGHGCATPARRARGSSPGSARRSRCWRAIGASGPHKENQLIMAQHRDTTSPSMVDDRGYALGRLISQMFHPVLMNILSFLVVGYYGLPTPAAGLAW